MTIEDEVSEFEEVSAIEYFVVSFNPCVCLF